MKFKNFLTEQNTQHLINEDNLLIENIKMSISKFKNIKILINMLEKIDISSVLSDIKIFLSLNTKNITITDLTSRGINIKNDIENIISDLLIVKNTIKTSYVDSIIVDLDKLINNITTHINIQKKDYDEKTIK